MQRCKRHIALLLVVGFLFPQVAWSLHFSLVSHNATQKPRSGYAKSDPNVQYHCCICHLSGSSPLLLMEEYKKTADIKGFQVPHNYFGLDHYVHQLNFNFHLRGPPFRHSFRNKTGLSEAEDHIQQKNNKNENQINLFIYPYRYFFYNFM